MRRKRLQHLADTLCHNFCGWRAFFDYNELVKLKTRTISSATDFPYPGARELDERRRSLYARCQILWEAVEKAGTLDSAKVRKAVLDNEFQTVMDKVKYDKNGVATFVSAASQWWEGKQMAVYPFELTNYKIKPSPLWKERR
jgi:hypothetical protein